jgi:hypothetical protein
MGLDTKTYWLTDRQSQCDFDFDLSLVQLWDIRQPVRTSAEDIFRICYQETTSEDMEDFICATLTVICRVCKPVRLL